MRYPTRQAPRAMRRAAAIAIAAIAHQSNPRSRERVGSGRRHTPIARGATAAPTRKRSRRAPADADADAGAGAETRVAPPRGAHAASPRAKTISKAALAAVKADAAKPRPTTKAGRKYRAERNAKLRERSAARASAKAAADEDRDALRAIVGRRLRLRLPGEDARRLCQLVGFDARTGAYRVRYDEGDEAEAHLARADVRFVACAKTDADVSRALRVAGKKRIQFESANASNDAKDKTAKKVKKAKKSDDVEGTRRTAEAEATTKARTNSNASSPNVVARDDTHVAAPSSSSPTVSRRHVVSATGGGPRRSVVMFDLIAELLRGAGAAGMTFAEILVALRDPDGPYLERLGDRLTCPAATNSIAGCISHNASLFHKVAPGRYASARVWASSDESERHAAAELAASSGSRKHPGARPGGFPGAPQLLPEMTVDEAWAAFSPFPLDVAVHGMVATREAWVCCDECGTWRRVPSAAAKIAEGSSSPWTCALSRHPGYASCAPAQELESDEIDRRVAAADALVASAVEAAEQYEARRERKRVQDAAYRLRKKLARENERQLAALESFLADEARAEADHPCVKALLLVVEGEGDDPGHVCVALVPCPARRARGDRREATDAERRRHLHRLRALAAKLASSRGKTKKTGGKGGGHGASKAYRIDDLWKKVTPRNRAPPAGLVEALRRHCPFAAAGKTLLGDRRRVPVTPVTPADVSDLVASMRRACISPETRAFAPRATPDLPAREVRVLRTPATAAVPPAPGFALVPAATDPFEDESRVFSLPDAMALNRAEMEMSDDDTEDADDAWIHAPIARLFPTALGARTGAETPDSDDDATTGPVEGTRDGWGAFGTRAARTPGDRVRGRFRDAALANAEAFRALSPEARAEATERAAKDTAPGFLPGVPAYAGVPFSRVPTWTHPHWPLGGMGDAPAGRPKAARKLPRVWRGKDLDMIIFGRDERLEWARKTGMFLARARTALGDRRLHRDAWGGSVLDSVMGAMLTQNVSDVLSSSAIMNLAAKFPARDDANPDAEEVAAAASNPAHAAPPVNEEEDEDEDEDEDRGEAEARMEPAKAIAPTPKRAREGSESEDGPDTPEGAEAKRVVVDDDEGGGELPANANESIADADADGDASPPSSPKPTPMDATAPFDSPQIPPARLSLVTAAAGASAYLTKAPPSASASQPPPPPAPPSVPPTPVHVAPTLLSTNPPSCVAPPPDLPRVRASVSSPASCGLTPAQPAAPSNADASLSPSPAGPLPFERRSADANGGATDVFAVAPRPQKKNKTQRIKEERAAFAARALATPDPSPRPASSRDLVDWRAVMLAPVEEVVECIKCRGMHYLLAGRIQRILRRVHHERGGRLSLEFLRDCPTDVAQGYLLSLEGFGVKTVSCILLLALYRADFPVDVNVGRIMARLGWVPLETEEALEELSVYAPEPAVYTFLRERLNSFGLQTLFELHYHMITLGKVFCEKRVPNCRACPLRDMCEYAISGGKRQVGSVQATTTTQDAGSAAPPPVVVAAASSPAPAPPGAAASAAVAATAEVLEGAVPTDASNDATARPLDPLETLEAVVEAGAAWDASGRPPVGAPAVLGLDPGADWPAARAAHARLSRLVHPDKCADPRAARAFALVTAARNSLVPAMPEDDEDGERQPGDDAVCVDERGEVIVGGAGFGSGGGSGDGGLGDIEDAFAGAATKGFARAAAAAAASMAASPLQVQVRPAPLNLNKIRHEMVAWSLPPDLIPATLLARAPRVDAECYLAVRCGHASAKSAAELAGALAGREMVPLAVLVPCRAAMLAKFPLHGTYFQTNEVFLDAETAARPHMVPARALDDLPTVSVFLGSSVHSITRGMSRAEVASAFADRAVCVRSWDHSQGGKPRPLPRWACPFLPRAVTMGPAPGEEQTYAATTTGGIVVAPAAAAAAAAPVNVEEDPDAFDMDERWDAYLGDADKDDVANTRARIGTRGGYGQGTSSRPVGSLANPQTAGSPWNTRVFAAFAERRRAAAAAARAARVEETRRRKREEQIRRERLGLDTPVVGDGNKRRRTVPVEEMESIARYFPPAAPGAA
jgi:endonuclease III